MTSWLVSVLIWTVLASVLVTGVMNKEHDFHYPLCSREGMTYGRYEHCNAPLDVTWKPEDFNPYFVHGGPGEGLGFSDIWLPFNCSYHRFTNTTAQHCAKSIQQHRNHSEEPLHIVMIGDSSTRSIFCGITRVLSGSELFGPCINKVCGTPATLPMTFHSLHQFHVIDFPPHFRFTFVYFRTLNTKGARETLLSSLTLHPSPFAIVFNSGAWDFDAPARARKTFKAPTEECENAEFEAARKERFSESALSVLKDFTAEAKNHPQTRLFYRNNHLNSRFGTLCADRDMEALLKSSEFREKWSIIDARNVSKAVWYEQDYDGFHFDRHRKHTYDELKGYMAFFKSKNWIAPGQLETTLSQVLLHHLLYDCFSLSPQFYRH